MANEKTLALRNYLRKLYLFEQYSSELDDTASAAVLQDLIDASDVSLKADKVTGAVSGNFAGLDSNGNLTDSGKNTNSFAAKAHNHDTRYIRLDADNTYDASLATGHRFEFRVANESPFDIDNTGGDILPTLTHLNADLVDGRHAAEFALATHKHDIYPRKASTENISGDWTFNKAGAAAAPFALASNLTGVVTYLNADKLDGNDAADFAAAVHTHAWGIITGTLADQTDLQAALDLKLPVPSASSANTAFVMPIYDILDPTVVYNGPAWADLALATDLATKYDEVAGVNDNFPAFATSGTTLVDSGYGASDFAAASHTHNDIYYTETEFGAGTLVLSIDQLTIASKVTLTSETAAGAGAGTLTNMPVAGNPIKFASVYIGATKYVVPLFASA